MSRLEGKLIVTLVAIILVVVGWGAFSRSNTRLEASQSELFYYYKDQKIPLRPIPDLFAVRLEQALDSESQLALLDSFGLEPITDVPGTSWYVVRGRSDTSLVDETLEITQTTQVFKADDGTAFFIPGQFYVQFEPSASETEIAELNSNFDVELNEKNEFLGNNYLLKVKNFSGETAVELANLYHEHELTEYATPSFVRLAYTNQVPSPNDTLYDEQWALPRIEALGAWGISTGSSDITIAVLDDGVDIQHPDLRDNIASGFDETDDPDDSPMPRYPRDSHGTGIAGIIGAATNNNQGVAGLAHNSRVMPVQIFYSQSSTAQKKLLCRFVVIQDQWVINGFQHAMNAGADVMNNSWGGGPRSTVIENAITTVVQQGRDGRGVVVVFASGNYNTSVSFPATLDSVIAVGATAEDDERATPDDWGTEWFRCWRRIYTRYGSNYGPELDVVAPGNNLSTTARNATYSDAFGGTSGAAPHVAGLAALVLSVNPDLTAQEVRELIEDTADAVDGYTYDANGWNAEVGHGRINAREALEALVPNIVRPTESRPLVAGSAESPSNIVVRAEAWEGFGREDFAVQVGGVDASVLTAVRSGNQHVLTIRPPIHSADGFYDLTVTIGSRSDTESNAVQYAANVGSGVVDVMLVIDRSGSMGGQRLTDAKSAAKQFIQLMQDGDKIGVASFSSGASVNYALTTIGGTVRDEASAAVDRIYASGSTSIGAGLRLAGNEFTSKGDPSHPWAIVLLSDGGENRSPYVADVLPDIASDGISVHTIALGSGANRTLMQHIASETGGTFHFAPTSQDLANIYSQISTAVLNQQTLSSVASVIQLGETVVHAVPVDNTVSQATFSISWPGSDLDLVLETPSGYLIDPSTAASDPQVEFTASTTFEFYRVSDPEPGQWNMRITAVDVPSSGEAYTARAVAEANLIMSLYFKDTSYFTEEPVILAATLSDNAPISGANVEVVVELPSSETAVFQLYDDGQHSDGEPNDGVYANAFTDTGMEGSYTFIASAGGVSNSGESFSRQANETIFVEQNPTPPTDLWIEAHGPNETLPGEPMAYTIKFGNFGPTEASNVLVELNLDTSTEYVTDSLGPGVSLSESGLSWLVGSLSVDSHNQFDVTVAVTSTITQTQQLASLFEIKSLGSDYFDPTNLNNISVVDTTVVAHIDVALDIKPGSDPNSINCTNMDAVIPVAILTAEDFDALTVDHATVIFEDASEIHRNNKTGEPHRHEEDVDGDGDLDLVFHFSYDDTSLTCESVEGTLSGQVFDGQAIEGTDSIRMVNSER